VKRELMIPDEVMRMGADRMLVMRPGHAPLVGRKVRYHADAEFAGRFDA
jgi:type IV secretion system protein VirD4